MLVEVTKKNAANFKAIAPQGELSRIVNDVNYFGIGYADDADSFPDGILIFHPEKETDDAGEVHTVLVITYFFVRESARDMYVGTYLFSNLVDMSEEIGVEAIRCDVPMDFEYNLLCNVLENFGFHFEVTEVFEFEVSLGKVVELKTFKKSPAEDADLLCDISPKDFSQGLGRLVKEKDIIDYGLSSNIEDYDTELSTVIMQGKYMKGVFLVKQGTDGSIEPVLLRASDNSSQTYYRLIHGALVSALGKYGKRGTLMIRLHNDAGLRLLSGVFKDYTPFIVRRGYFYI